MSYLELFRSVNRAGNAFPAVGLRIEERIALLVTDVPEFAYSFFGR
jgi:acyl-coenzyme A synthetase/AMP-(fatty) acid ligase